MPVEQSTQTFIYAEGQLVTLEIKKEQPKMRYLILVVPFRSFPPRLFGWKLAKSLHNSIAWKEKPQRMECVCKTAAHAWDLLAGAFGRTRSFNDPKSCWQPKVFKWKTLTGYCPHDTCHRVEKIEETFTLDKGSSGADRKKVEPSDLSVSLDLQVPKRSVRSTRLRIKLKWLEVRFMHVKFCLLNCYFSFV